MEILFKVVVEPDEDGIFIATTPSLKGVVGQGTTEREAVLDFTDALNFTLECMEEDGESLPESDESARGLPTVEDAGRNYQAAMVV